ncbi:phosphogluconate dehydratase [Microvirga sp. W0021]|uniref:Phosphogluconate dehydratase n=1 Tax=Hohaiivirga grylli TaxID=3133970 RepID=A0ABV0BHB2_9HYPH
MTINSRIGEITQRIVERSKATRSPYLERMQNLIQKGPARKRLGCANLAHGFAGCGTTDKERLATGDVPNIGIVTAYNDMLSAHKPYEHYPELIREEARRLGAVAEVAGGVPAMCDGVTQGEAGMELSLFSRDVIAMGTGIALSHQMFDAAVALGICDKIVPGLVIGAVTFSHLPTIFIPSGPMPTGISNGEKNKVREEFAQGKVGRDEMLAAEGKAYHSPGTCTFYGTANTNQMLMEFMGLHLPGASFVSPDSLLREALTRAAIQRALQITGKSETFTPIGEVLDERAFVNGIVGLNATGGSTNLTIHLIAMARAAGIILNWDDFEDIADITPLLARAYPNGIADVNQFHAAGGVPYIIKQLLDEKLLHADVKTVWGQGMAGQAQMPKLNETGELYFEPVSDTSNDETVVRPSANPFQPTGGLKVLAGNLGRSVIKTSAISEDKHIIEAPARVFNSQEEVQQAFKAGELKDDFIAVVRFQGPKANGMPELHKLIPPLSVLQNLGQKVALVTDGRMSGASGKVPAAIHVTPEAVDGGAIAKIKDGDIIRVDAVSGKLECHVDATEWAKRQPATRDLSAYHSGIGRELFSTFRHVVGSAEDGACALGI